MAENVHPRLEKGRGVITAIAMSIVALFASRARARMRASASNWPIWGTSAASTRNVSRDTALTQFWAGDGGGAHEMEMGRRVTIAITTIIAQAANAFADMACWGSVLIGKIGVGIPSKEFAVMMINLHFTPLKFLFGSAGVEASAGSLTQKPA